MAAKTELVSCADEIRRVIRGMWIMAGDTFAFQHHFMGTARTLRNQFVMALIADRILACGHEFFMGGCMRIMAS